MKQDAWNLFLHTGDIKEYLRYKENKTTGKNAVQDETGANDDAADDNGNCPAGSENGGVGSNSDNLNPKTGPH